MKSPDIRKVLNAVALYESRPTRAKDWREYPIKPSPMAQDAAIRKQLKSHGNPCRGWDCHHFLHEQ